MSFIAKSIRPILFTSAALVIGFSAALSGSPAQAQDPGQGQEALAVVVKDYDVFVDLPTAFAYIKLPAGWKFIGKLDAEQLRRLPQGTLTSLLPAEQSATRYAAKAPVLMAKAATRPVR